MYTYYFSSEFDDIESDISGEKYKALLMKFQKYCPFFSLDIIKLDTNFTNVLSGFKLQIPSIKAEGLEPTAKREFYYFNEKSLNLLCKISDSIFSYSYYPNRLPENLCFYRKDFSLLFSSMSHDGECYMILNDEEIDCYCTDIVWKPFDISNFSYGFFPKL